MKKLVRPFSEVLHWPTYRGRCSSTYTTGCRKMAVFWDVAPCSLVDTGRHIRGSYCLHHQVTHRPDKGVSKFVWNVGQYLRDYTVPHTRRQPSYSSPWEPETRTGYCSEILCLPFKSPFINLWQYCKCLSVILRKIGPEVMLRTAWKLYLVIGYYHGSCI
jgi:hypothetical protein